MTQHTVTLELMPRADSDHDVLLRRSTLVTGGPSLGQQRKPGLPYWWLPIAGPAHSPLSVAFLPSDPAESHGPAPNTPRCSCLLATRPASSLSSSWKLHLSPMAPLAAPLSWIAHTYVQDSTSCGHSAIPAGGLRV